MEPEVQRPQGDGLNDWKAYWTAQGMPWRTQPEIDSDRQAYLAARRAVTPDIDQGIYPFQGERLTRADVEWLLVTHESKGMRGPVDWSDLDQRQRVGLDLRGVDVGSHIGEDVEVAFIEGVDLSGLPLARTRFGVALDEVPVAVPEHPELDAIPIFAVTGGLGASISNMKGTNLYGSHLEYADLPGAQLQYADLRGAHLEGAFLGAAYLQGAAMMGAHFDRAFLSGAHLDVPPNAMTGMGAIAHSAHFEGASLRDTHLEGAYFANAFLEDADLRGAYLSTGTMLNGARLGSPDDGLERLADVRWGGARIALVQWVTPSRRPRKPAASAGGDRSARAAARLISQQRSLRATRQLAVLMREQGLADQADDFSYQAARLQRRVQRTQGRWGRVFGSWLLDAVSGYGYKPIRSVITYVLIVVAFAAIYFVLGSSHGALSWNEALVVSMTAFHGRGFFGNAFQPGDPQAAVAAAEALVGLLIEITFIATFTQRFFGR